MAYFIGRLWTGDENVAQADLTFQPNLANLALPELRRACDVAGDQRLRGCRNKETIHHVRKSVTPHEKLFPSEGSAVRQNFAGGIRGTLRRSFDLE
jgi:hypothetical protein